MPVYFIVLLFKPLVLTLRPSPLTCQPSVSGVFPNDIQGSGRGVSDVITEGPPERGSQGPRHHVGLGVPHPPQLQRTSAQPWRSDHPSGPLLRRSLPGCGLSPCQAAGLRARRARGRASRARAPRPQEPGIAAGLAQLPRERRLQAAAWPAARPARRPHLERLTNEPTTPSRSSRAAFVAV